MNTRDALDGIRDCKHGLPADPNRSEEYHHWYGVEYTRQQIMTNLSTQQNEAIYGTHR